jgi:anti-sigma factor RsiW
MEIVAALVGGELDAHAQAAVISHLHRCPECRAELGQISWLARALQTTRDIEVATDTPHLTDLEVAAFVTNSLRGPQAAHLEAHVARCAQCAHLLASVRKALDEFAELFGEPTPPPPEPPWPRIIRDVRRALMSFPTASALIGALLLFLAQCGFLALPIAQVFAALLHIAPFLDGTPDFAPLASIPDPWLRLLAYFASCLAGALVTGWTARRLYRWALTRHPDSPGGR